MAGSGGGNRRGRGRVIDGINITPMVDITLVLLVVLIVTAQVIVQPSVPFDLPTAAHSDAQQTIFAVSIDQAGQITVDQTSVDLGQLGVRCRIALQQNPDIRAVIQAHRDVSHGQVLTVIDTMRGQGLTRIAFATQPPDVTPSLRGP